MQPANPVPDVPPRHVPLYRQLYFQVVVAIFVGAVLGYFEPAFAESLKPLGDAFIKLVKMIIAPVIFLTIVTGIAGMRHLATVGRVFVKSMVYFLFFSTLALIIGLIVAHVIQPGAGMHVSVADLDQAQVTSYVEKSHELTLTGFLMDIIPKTLVSPFVGDNILQVLFVSVLFGIALALVGERGKPVLDLLEALTAPVFRLVHILMRAAPIGAARIRMCTSRNTGAVSASSRSSTGLPRSPTSANAMPNNTDTNNTCRMLSPTNGLTSVFGMMSIRKPVRVSSCDFST